MDWQSTLLICVAMVCFTIMAISLPYIILKAVAKGKERKLREKEIKDTTNSINGNQNSKQSKVVEQ